ncbi:Dienelactone hydrolase [Oceaniovalibus guishaninsula JLT2003]|uniref:Dienelactone hydrolase n=1 Tax=Oceaniovalibus guishaninsula JLT2003 TaxID=1231392 RepID=K2H9C5_9RHOB|nr:dienelactone hydrolase family protein [Oceaniovalibus guishaninsula]EKE43202.1 Dienelactone hydrolase [Oceaniovalibus guishaninsula JLT2003]
MALPVIARIAPLAGLLATPVAAEIVAEPHSYDIGGATYEGYVARNTALEESRGTVVIVHDWDGLTDYERRRAEMLAELGYTAFAIDMFGAGRRPQSVEENRQFTSELYADRDAYRERLLGAMTEAGSIPGATENRVLIGYCFGGSAVLEAARAGADMDGFAAFHPGLGTAGGQDWSATPAPIVFFHGTADPVASPVALVETLTELEQAGIEHSANIYGGARHAFTVFGSEDYDLDADLASWAGLTEFLEMRLR